MKAKIFFILTMISFSMIIVLRVNAQENVQKIDQGILNFSKYLGKWHSNVTFKSEGKTENMDYTIEYSSIADGHGVYMEETAKSPEGLYKCGNMAGYDPYAKKLHWYSVDNMGTAHDHAFSWLAPDHFTLLHKSMRNGKEYTEKVDCRFTSDKSCDMVYVATLGGKETERMEGKFDRVSQ
jgi:hypothetical protein